jgi:hypothetical protein
MSKQKNNFKTNKIFNTKHLESVVNSNMDSKQNSYYLITNSWDKVCNYFNDRLPNDGTTDLNVIDIFNVPNALDVIKSAIKSHRETISTACLSRYDQLPMLVVIHKTFPRVVSYNGSVGAEIGI